MGLEIEQEVFSAHDYAHFRVRLRSCLRALRELLARPDFGLGPASLGAELELALVGADGHALPLNRAVLQETTDPRFAVELDRFNLECNLRPTALAGRPFAAMKREMQDALRSIQEAAGRHGGRTVTVGILPTLQLADLHPQCITDSVRYRVLSSAVRRLRGRPFRFHIDGSPPLCVQRDDVVFEGAATSLQLHLRVSPGEFATAFNAAQLATAPVLAVAGNSPIFLEQCLWEETRVALFKQAVDDRTEQQQRQHRPPRVGLGQRWVERGALELFEEAASHAVLLPVVDPDAQADTPEGTPLLTELRLHQGTVWRWNRPVYDPAAGGHLRIELRALPAGPTITDMLANSAFLIGLIHGLRPAMADWVRELPFDVVEHNFYRAAQHGLAAELFWVAPRSGQALRQLTAEQLVLELLPIAQQGLAQCQVETEDAEPWLQIIADRCRRRQTGATWQRGCLQGLLDAGVDRGTALVRLLERYMAHCQSGQPVHTWPLP